MEGRAVYQCWHWPAEFISFNGSNLTHTRLTRCLRTITAERKARYVCDNTDIAYTFATLQHPIRTCSRLRPLQAFQLTTFTQKGNEIASLVRGICHWPL